MNVQDDTESLNSRSEWEEVKSLHDVDEASWTEVQSLVSLDSLGDLITGESSNRNPVALDEAASEGSEAPDASDLFSLQNQNEIKSTPISSPKDSSPKAKQIKKQPWCIALLMNWTRKIKNMLKAIGKLSTSLAKEADFKCKWNVASKWLMSEEVWPFVKNGVIVCSIATGIAVCLQKRIFI
eukprot:g1447.t1